MKSLSLKSFSDSNDMIGTTDTEGIYEPSHNAISIESSDQLQIKFNSESEKSIVLPPAILL